MHFAAAAASLYLAALAVAQSTNVTIIEVGSTTAAPGGIFQFVPPMVNATNGTIITFRFSGAPGNHSVTQSTFEDPCDPAPGGFDSGWVLISAPVTPVPEWNLTIIDDTKPIWFFCKQLIPAPHCTIGMVGAINPPTSGNTFANFQNTAHVFSGNPGQAIGNLVGQGASASAPPGPIPPGVTLFDGVGTPLAASTGISVSSTNIPANGVATGATTIMNPIGLGITALLGMILT